MAVKEKLSSVQGKRSKELNKALAKEIADKNDRKSIDELAGLLGDKDKNIQSDSIEVLYETGYIKPELIKGLYKLFADLLSSKNNRLVWGAMIALSTISRIDRKTVYKELPAIINAVDKGSVITKDAGVVIYANLATNKNFKKEAFPLLLKELKRCPAKQIPQYAEKSLIAIDDRNRKEFIGLINKRIKELDKESQVKRIKKVLKEV